MKYYLTIFLRRLPIFLLIAITISALAVGLAMSLPPIYGSQARFLMESSQIPDALAPPTANASAREQLQLFEQRLMSRTNLLDIARKLKVFDKIDKMRPDEIVDAMRAQTTISSNITKGGAAIMTVRFSADTGRKAAGVLGEYVTLIQQQDVEQRTGRAGRTLDFFQQDVDRLNSELATISAKLIEFKTANSDALPDGASYRLNQQGILQERVAQSEREIATLGTQREKMIEIFNQTGRIDGLSGADLTPAEKGLQEVQAELDQALTVYAPSNPRIKVLQGRLAQAQALVAKQAGSATVGASPLDLKLAEIDGRVAALKQQQDETEAALDKLNDAIQRSAGNAIQLAGLERDYANTQAQYNKAVGNLAQASTGERIELLSRGEKISLLEQPVEPTQPSAPNRILLAGGGSALGILAGLGVILLIELLNTAPRRPEAIVRKLGITPLTTLPYIQTRQEVRRQRRITIAVVLAIIIGVPIGVWAIHTYYQPLDLLGERIANKLGIRW
jgi:uncharacterized protein involved in exopolysaccharide biosynthesis